MAKLIQTDTWWEHPLPEGVTSLGRMPTNTIEVIGQWVSRQHCAIEGSKGRWVLTDCGSKMGTFVNGKRINGPQQLRSGNEIRVGSVLYLFKDEESPHTPPATRAPHDRSESLIGQTFGQYEMLELLGRGGMGAVYKARQQSLNRLCAVKVLPQQFARDPSFLERFHREGRAAAAINHPNVIKVFDVGQDKGYSFLVMEYVEGEALNSRLKRDGPSPPETALALLKQTASALAAAHALGIVHRDIKPGNILIAASGEAKVADFGLAKQSGVDVSVTVPGSRLGTPAYMAPELVRGERADARSDLYSLGATFYHAVAGRCPFEGSSAAEVLVKVMEEEPASLDAVAPHAPDILRRVIHRLLAKNPGKRIQTGQEVLDALEPRSPTPTGPRAAKAAPPRSAAPSIEERRAARKRRQRRSLILAGGIALLIIAGLVLLLLLAR